MKDSSNKANTEPNLITRSGMDWEDNRLSIDWEDIVIMKIKLNQQCVREVNCL